jgi:hypothetical protein
MNRLVIWIPQFFNILAVKMDVGFYLTLKRAVFLHIYKLARTAFPFHSPVHVYHNHFLTLHISTMKKEAEYSSEDYRLLQSTRQQSEELQYRIPRNFYFCKYEG